MEMGGKKSHACELLKMKELNEVEDGKIDVSFSEEEQANSRYTLNGLKLHDIEVADVSKKLEPYIHELRDNMKAYKVYDKWLVRPPSKGLENHN